MDPCPTARLLSVGSDRIRETEMNAQADWAGDETPSLPQALKRVKMISFGGFCFTDGGIAHDVSHADRERMQIPPFAPPARAT